MSRALRIDQTGFYHVSNRGVGLREVFLSNEDRIYFIRLMCQYAAHYEFHVHGYAIISNGYNILIETTRNNLPHIMKALNGQYTSYFNRKYLRKGHLWQGRYESWYIEDKGFILEILRYIEHLPVYTGSATEKQHYSYSSYRQFIGIDERLSCMMNSIVFQQFNTFSEIKSFFNKPVDTVRINRIHQLLKKHNRQQKIRPKKKLPDLTEAYFVCECKEERDKKIYRAYKKGYSQAYIGSLLCISQQAVYKIIKKYTQV